MGAVLSQVVFQPPEQVKYSVDENGYFTLLTPSRYESSKLIQNPLLFLRTSRNINIAALMLRVPDAKHTILLSHGTSEDISTTAPWAAELANALNSNVLIYDYSGYGLSTKRTIPMSPTSAAVKPSEKYVYADCQAAYKYLIEEERIAPRDICLMGRSLGSGPAVHLAKHYPVGGLIIVCGVASIVRVARPQLLKTPRFDMFCNVDKIANVKCPVLILHGRQDDVVPFECGLALYAKAAEAHPHRTVPPLWIDDANHNNLETFNRPKVFQAYNDFLENWVSNKELRERIDAEWFEDSSFLLNEDNSSILSPTNQTADDSIPAEEIFEVLGRTRKADQNITVEKLVTSYSRKDLPEDRSFGDSYAHKSPRFQSRRASRRLQSVVRRHSSVGTDEGGSGVLQKLRTLKASSDLSSPRGSDAPKPPARRWSLRRNSKV
mmetsp:Transcript_6710/g.11985  ORF Transcript_6710/g.11985 Transcript_6710/m.11985 type:complete len:435 (-) Transcript_6710:1557-2861(-)|eukprot:CAMPEP_0182447712 /NCGR_PEP_ID=MMETSP1172-20130603/19127_1 /TAXON_ID=708627 /ORGANISM="Timspurckia oligopyrenoides, Strain CCMP3278" /LENGTH=434 /DNA_ID=CAMNT_0024644253 /DNA_START=50 /DNA_END=1354 /DNA_ORIENTATION=-